MEFQIDDMQNKEDKKQNLKWNWHPCIYNFKKKNGLNEIAYNLSPYVMIAGDDPKVFLISKSRFYLKCQSMLRWIDC